MILKAENTFEHKYVLQYKWLKQYNQQYGRNNQKQYDQQYGQSDTSNIISDIVRAIESKQYN